MINMCDGYIGQVYYGSFHFACHLFGIKEKSLCVLLCC